MDMDNSQQPIDQCWLTEHESGLSTQMIGLTKREYFAAMAIQGIAVEFDNAKVAAQRAVRCADALLSELTKPIEP